MLVALTIFLGAFLLFAVEPLIAKMILPWFGGSAGVWIVCLLFFQGALLAGYSYAHFLARWFSAGRQWRVHLFLLVVSLLFLPIIPSDSWKPAGAGEPLLRILVLLTATIGLPFLLLAATGPLVQAWFSRRERNANSPSVYRLYALSNFGALLALLSYPIVMEPLLATRVQAWSWSLAYVLFVLLSGALAWRYRGGELEKSRPESDLGDRAKRADRLLWFALAAIPSMLLLAVTNYMLRNIAAIPLLWIVPLSLYLLSFIICFDHSRWYYRPLWYGLLPAAVGAMMLATVAPFLFADYAAQLAVCASAFFICCMTCHGELASQKPASHNLTSFYLTIACGGAVGGLSVAAMAPAVFNYDHDLTIALLLFAALIGFVTLWRLPASTPAWVRWNGGLLLLGVCPMLIALLVVSLRAASSETLLAMRNFYGPLRVVASPASATRGALIELHNGNIMHGREFTARDKQCQPLSYYARSSGVGIAMQEIGRVGDVHIGVIGLGAGTIAGYARPRDVFRFYEINPLVRDVATNVFRYLSCAERWSVEMGDARLSLEREAPNNFDLLAVDAFTSDAIPVHLLTREAFALYWRHIKPGGILAVHVSNTFIDLAPIVAVAAAQSGKTARVISADADDAKGISRSIWVLVADNPEFFASPALKNAKTIGGANSARAWTDDYSNLWRALKW